MQLRHGEGDPMSAPIDDLGTTGSTADPAWYRRRGSQVALAGAAAAGVVVAGLAAGSTANANLDPEAAVAEASENLQDPPTAVTITSSEGEGEITLVSTDDGAQVSISAPEEGAYLSVALVGEQLFLRVAADQIDQLAGNPLAAGLVAGFPGLGALLDGQWVTLDVSEDSPVLAALQARAESQVSDPAALQAAGEELQQALESIGEDLRDPVATALDANVSVTEAADPQPGPSGSTHYQVALDRDAVVASVEPALRTALAEALAAIDAFVAEAGAQLPDGGEGWAEKRGELEGALDEALAEGASEAPSPVDVWVADGEFTQIQVRNATLLFERDPQLDLPDTAVSLDEDLLRILPLLENFESVLGGAGFPAELLQ